MDKSADESNASVQDGLEDREVEQDRGRTEDKPAADDNKASDEETIQNYAEHTMNELLGLFGYDDKVNSTDTENLNLENYTDSKDGDSDDKTSDVTPDKRKTSAKLRIRSKQRAQPRQENSVKQQHMSLVSAFKQKEKEVPESSDTKSNPEAGSLQQCDWCHKTGSKQETLDTPTGSKVFCSEVCFTQCRRASFKKSKVCNWCKHVRHTVNYVEFTDGEAQLQFCSEKCLNQYKMSVFCKETQELSKKLNKSETKTSSESKDSENRGSEEILITPDLWLAGENGRRVTEVRRDTARARERQERFSNRRDHSTRSRSNTTSHEQTLDLSNKRPESRPESSEGSRSLLLDRIKLEPDSKSRRSVLTKERDQISPSRVDRNTASPAEQTTLPLPPLLHPAMAPWLHHAQMMTAMSPGMVPLGQFPPIMLTGLMPPSTMAAPTGELPKASSTAVRNDEPENEHRTPAQQRDPPASSSLLSPQIPKKRPSTSPRQEVESSPVPERRTSSLFPVDFPHFLQHGGVHIPPHLQASIAEATAVRPPVLPGMPPVTVMMPFPVAVPCPVPIPIPIPMTVKQLADMFGHKLKDETTEKSSGATHIDAKKSKVYKSPLPRYSISPQSVKSSESEIVSYDRHEPRAVSRNSCPDMTTYGYNDVRMSQSEGYAYKRSRTPESLDLSRTSKIPRYEFRSQSEDCAIDLSSRGNGDRSEDNCSDSGAINGNTSDDSSAIFDTGEEVVDGQTVPKIHIITHKDEAPLNAALPLPPTEHPYSSRRGLILDAPSVKKKTRSPSPERRVYVRNVPRDFIEAARRRCGIRARIRTK